ncbi:hypothetical protein CCANI_11540 [Corynebacterium canis]|nr:hypothetical protein CCANI_11540 [Corynebacterium canis]
MADVPQADSHPTPRHCFRRLLQLFGALTSLVHLSPRQIRHAASEAASFSQVAKIPLSDLPQADPHPHPGDIVSAGRRGLSASRPRLRTPEQSVPTEPQLVQAAPMPPPGLNRTPSWTGRIRPNHQINSLGTMIVRDSTGRHNPCRGRSDTPLPKQQRFPKSRNHPCQICLRQIRIPSRKYCFRRLRQLVGVSTSPTRTQLRQIRHTASEAASFSQVAKIPLSDLPQADPHPHPGDIVSAGRRGLSASRPRLRTPEQSVPTESQLVQAAPMPPPGLNRTPSWTGRIRPDQQLNGQPITRAQADSTHRF